MAAAINPRPRLLQHLILPLQLLLYIGLFSVCDLLVRWLHLPLPANVLGMVMLLLLIVLRVLPLGWVRAGANWLLAEMLLFFIPALMSLLDYGVLVRDEGWRILLVIGVSTLLVMVVTAFTVEAVCRWRLRHEV